jgi:hypothetical protein
MKPGDFEQVYSLFSFIFTMIKSCQLAGLLFVSRCAFDSDFRGRLTIAGTQPSI